MVLGVGIPLAGGTVAVGTALTRSSKFLTAAANFVLGIAVQKGLEKLGEWLVEQVGEGALSNAFGPVGWALKLVAAGLDFEQIAITTGEVLSSPPASPSRPAGRWMSPSPCTPTRGTARPDTPRRPCGRRWRPGTW